MKTAEKAKYIGIGALAMTVAIPLVIKATDAVPLTFSQGDILSAEVLNQLFDRINTATKPLTRDELAGTWQCTSYKTSNQVQNDGNCVGGFANIYQDSDVNGLKEHTQTVTFTSDGKYSTSESLFARCAAAQTDSNYSILGDRIFLSWTAPGETDSNFMPFKKVGVGILSLDHGLGAGGNLSSDHSVCVKQSIPPLPPTTLSATANGAAVTLTWVDQSTDETGFKVQTKTEVGGTWTTLETTVAGIQTATAVGATGNNWYRVLATNANGDSITSNEILVEIE